MPERRIIAGLDIGTSKVCAIIGETGCNGELNIFGVGTSPSYGLKKGMVVNLDKTVQAITAAVGTAERMAGVEVSSVCIGVAGGHIASFNSHGVVAVANSNEITAQDVRRVLEAAKVVALPSDRRIIHVLPREYIVDSCRGIKDPEGMAGKRLEVNVHIVTGAVTAFQNIIKCVERAGLEVEDLVLQPIASSISVLTLDEQDSGTVLIDIGGGTTDLAVFYEGSICHTGIIPVGGNHFTQDLAFGLRIPFAEAERLKLQYSQGPFEEIVQPRSEELFVLVKEELTKLQELNIVPVQCVLTGGASQLYGLKDIAQAVLDLPVRIGSPSEVGGLFDMINSPVFATGIGLLLYSSKYCSPDVAEASFDSLWLNLADRIKQWFKDFIPLE